MRHDYTRWNIVHLWQWKAEHEHINMKSFEEAMNCLFSSIYVTFKSILEIILSN